MRPMPVVFILVLAQAVAGDKALAGEPWSEAPPAASPAVTLSVDPEFSLETGAHLTSATTTAIAEIEARAFRFAAGRGPGRIAFRAVRTLVLDLPLASWLAVLQHEAFGHGGRAREFGASAGVHMGSPWSGRSSYATFDAEGLSTEELLRVYAGGAESNGWSATLFEREAVAGRPFHSFELLHLVRSRLVTSQYVLLTTPDPEDDPTGFFAEYSGGGDVAHYLGLLNTRHYGEPGIALAGASASVVREFHRLRRQAYWNAADPGVWLALWTIGRRVLDGEGPQPLPVPRLGGRPFLPLLSADWLPDGGLISVESVFGRAQARDAHEGGWYSFTLRRGSGPAGPFGAAGAATDRFRDVGGIQLGGELELWTRPERSLGGGARLRMSLRRGRAAGLFFDLGAKSAGHWPGRPAEPGVFLAAGYRVKP